MPLAGGLAVCLVYGLVTYFILNHRQAALSLEKGDYEERLNLLNAEMGREAQAISALRQKIANYSILKNLTEKLCATFSKSDTAQVIAMDVNSIYRGKQMTVIVYFFEAHSHELSLLTSVRDQELINLKAKKGDLYDQWVVKSLKPLLVEDAKSDFRFDPEKIQTEDDRLARSLISAPLTVGEKTVGILRVDSPAEHSFNTEDLRFLTTVADLGAVALENAQLFERVEDLAIRDSLTGVFLRRYLLERLSREVARHAQQEAELSFLMIDLDNFKKYNDRFGHTAGDIVLKTIALILTEMFNKPGQVVCRYGGEEFCILLPDCSKKKAAQLAEDIRRRVESQTIILRRERTKITVSIGVASLPKDGRAKEELVQKADAALYKAKSEGRNRVVSA